MRFMCSSEVDTAWSISPLHTLDGDVLRVLFPGKTMET
jgi:hypothetical protein